MNHIRTRFLFIQVEREGCASGGGDGYFGIPIHTIACMRLVKESFVIGYVGIELFSLAESFPGMEQLFRFYFDAAGRVGVECNDPPP